MRARDPREGRSALTPDAVDSALREAQRKAIRPAPRVAAPDSAFPLLARGDGAPFLMPTRSQGGREAHAPVAYGVTPRDARPATPLPGEPYAVPGVAPRRAATPATPDDVAAQREREAQRERYAAPRVALVSIAPPSDVCPGVIGPTLPGGVCPACHGRHAR